MEENLQSVVNMMVGLPAAGSQVTVTCWSLSATTLRYIHIILQTSLRKLYKKSNALMNATPMLSSR